MIRHHIRAVLLYWRGDGYMSNLGQSGEDYLETILVLGNCNGEVRSVDIAREMNVTKPSVCRAVGLLKNGGFIRVDDNGYITFTDDGRKAAESVYERHTVLTDWLIGIGVDEKTAAEDACRLEHNISAQSFDKLKKHIRKYHNTNHQ